MKRNDFESFIPRMFPDITVDRSSRIPRLTPCPACGSVKGKPCVLLEGSTKIYCHDGGCKLSDHPRDLQEFVSELKLWHKIGKPVKSPVPAQLAAISQTYTNIVRNHEIYRAAAVFFHINLLRNPLCRDALDYQLKTRGHQLKTLMNFQVGFTGHMYDLPEKLVSLSHWSRSQILGCGLFTPDGLLKACMRYSYPIVWQKKTRSIKFKPSKPNDRDLYIPVENTGDDFPLVFNSQELEADEPLLVEGENDLLSMWESGETHVVSMLGNLKARTLDFMDAEKTYRLAFDHDPAGRGYQTAMKSSFKTRVFGYPEEFKDPDDWCQERRPMKE